MNVNIVIFRGKYKCMCSFSTITEAYRFYLKKYSTIGEWWYYLKTAHYLLNFVDNEETMKSIFRNVFNKNVFLIIDNEK